MSNSPKGIGWFGVRIWGYNQDRFYFRGPYLSSLYFQASIFLIFRKLYWGWGLVPSPVNKQ